MLMRVCEIVIQGFTLVALNVSRSTAYRLVKLARDIASIGAWARKPR